MVPLVVFTEGERNMKEIEAKMVTLNIDGKQFAKLNTDTSSVTVGNNKEVTIFTNDELIVRLCKIIVDLKNDFNELSKRQNEAMEIAQRYKEKYEALRDEVRKDR